MGSEFKIEAHPAVLLRPRISFPYAWAGHIPFAYLAVDLLRPRTLVELGTDSGNSYLAFCQAVRVLGTETRCTAVDSWEGDDHARRYGSQVFDELSSYHDPRYGGFSKLKRSFFDEAVADFEDGSIDLLHIDGLHTYEAVKHDFDTWKPKLSRHAVVLFHDTCIRERDFGVWKFLEELSADQDVFNFHHSNGLGVVCIGDDIPEPFREFMAAAKSRPEQIRQYFEALASTIVDPDGGLPRASDVAVRVGAGLYFRNMDEPYSDLKLINRPVMAEQEILEFRFELPAGSFPDFVRFDPADCPGLFRIDGFAIAAGEQRWIPDDIHSRLGAVSGDILPVAGGRTDALRLVCFNADPYVEFDLAGARDALPADAAMEVQVCVRYDALLSQPAAARMAAAEMHALSDLRAAATDQFDLRAITRQLRADNDRKNEDWRDMRSLLTSGLLGTANDILLRTRVVGQPFSVAEVLRAETGEAADGTRIRFALPAGAVYDSMRVELPLLAGRYRIDSVAVDGAVIRDFGIRVIAMHARRLQPALPEQIRFSSDGGISWIEFDLHARAASVASSILEMILVREDPASASDESLSALHAALADFSRNITDLVSGQRHDAHRQSMRLDQLSDRLDTRLAEHANAIADTDRGILATRQRVEDVVKMMQNVFWRRWLRRLVPTKK